MQEIALTAVRPDDSDALFRWINDPETVRLSAAFRPIPRSDHDAWFDRVTRPRDDLAYFAIRAAGRLVGTCQLFDISPVHRSAELQIRIGYAEARHKGYGTEAIKQLLAFGRTERRLHRVWLRVFARNGAAIRCYEKAGFEREGLQRDAACIDGEFIDVVLMGKLL